MTFLVRRPLVAAVSAALLALSVAGCASREEAPEPVGDAADTSFPVTIEHRLGSTTLESRPERVLTVGWNDQDFVTALGVVPVGTREWFEDYGDLPWVSAETGGAEIPTFGGEIDFEAIAAARPDVILAIYEEFDQKVYDKLSRIAPTVLQPEEYGVDAMPWDEQTLLTGRALGMESDAEALVEEVDDTIARVAQEHPEFAEQTLVVDYGPSDEGHWLVPAGDPRRAIFDALGFATQEHEKDLSAERLDLLDSDVLFVFGASAGELEDPVFDSLDVVAEDRSLFVGWDAPLAGAMSYSGPLAMLYALDRIVPELVNATDGDPSTEVGDLDAA